MSAAELGPSVRLLLKVADLAIEQLEYELRRAPYVSEVRRIDAEIKEMRRLREQSERVFRGQLAWPES